MVARAEPPDRRGPIALAMAVVVVGCLPAFAVGALVTRIGGDFDFGDRDLGIAIAAFYGVSAVISPACGRLVGRLGSGNAIWISAASTATGSLLIATVADSAATLIAALLLATVGNAQCAPVASAYVESTLPPRRFGVASGVMQAGAPAGSLIAGLALPAIAIPFGWRWVFVASALASVLVALLLRPGPHERRRSSGTEGPALEPRVLASVRWLAVTAALASCGAQAMVSFLVLFASEHGIAEGNAGVVVAGVGAGAGIGRIALGLAADRAGRPLLGLTTAMIAASAVGYLLLIVEEPVAIVAGAIVAATLGWSWAGMLTLACVRAAPAASARAVGVMMSGLFAGNVAGPLVAGWLAEDDRFTLIWCLSAGLALVAATVLAIKGRRLA